jgi:hypothetical protein
MRHVSITFVVLAMLLGCAVLGATYLLAPSGTSAAALAPDPFAAYLKAPTTKLSSERLLAIARSESSRAGETHPTISSVSQGSFEDAMRSVDPSTIIPETNEAGERAMFATPVSLVVMQGTFTLQNAHVPVGVGAPKRSVLDLIIDERTGDVMGQILPSPASVEGQLPLATAASRNSASGTVVGTLRIGGGPARPGSPRSWPAKHKHVVVMTTKRHVIARTTTTASGRFRVRLRPGHYLVAGAVSPSTLCLPKTVAVRPATISNTQLACSIK